MLATVTYVRPTMYPAQQDAIFTDARYGIIEATTKAGKTVGCLTWLHEQAALYGADGRNYWWIAPIYPQAKIAYRRLKRFLRGYPIVTNESELTITLANGAVIWFKGAHDPDSLYGEDVYAAVIDEATRVKAESWHAVRSTLSATGGPVRIIGNVKGRKNWAYKLARRAESGQLGNAHYAKLTAWDAIEGGVMDRAEVEDARSVLPEPVFQQLYLAEPVDDGTNPFGLDAIDACTTDQPATDDKGEPADTHCWGWDLARGKAATADWTVGIGLTTGRHWTRLEKFQGPWDSQISKIRRHTQSTRALVDATGVGDPIVEQLQAGGGNYTPFVYTGPSRQQLLVALSLHVHQGTIRFPQSVADELHEFEFTFTPSGGVKYAVPEGFHDDEAMALALASKHVDSGPPRYRSL